MLLTQGVALGRGRLLRPQQGALQMAATNSSDLIYYSASLRAQSPIKILSQNTTEITQTTQHKKTINKNWIYDLNWKTKYQNN